MKPENKEKLICSGCGYETEYLGTYLKPPACPNCKNLLSFKDSASVRPNEAESISVVNWTLKVLAVLFLAGSLLFMSWHFQTYARRALVLEEARFGESFYGGHSRSQISSTWKQMAYSFDVYWGKKFQGRTTMMIQEEHWYIYKGTRRGFMDIEYTYSDSKGKKGNRMLSLRLVGNSASLDIPAIPYAKKSSKIRLKLTADTSGSRIRISL